jgi:hypothetical protein
MTGCRIGALALTRFAKPGWPGGIAFGFKDGLSRPSMFRIISPHHSTSS